MAYSDLDGVLTQPDLAHRLPMAIMIGDNAPARPQLGFSSASIVYQVVDNRTNAVVAQYPDEAVLRRRAYFHTLDLTKGEPTRLLATDRKA